MWQRIQTLYLAVAAAAAIGLLFITVGKSDSDILIPKNDITSVILCCTIAAISLYTITRYRNRSLQRRLSLLNMLLSIALFIWIIIIATRDEYMPFKFGACIPIICMLLFLFAARAIKKDDNLVKSMDRFR